MPGAPGYPKPISPWAPARVPGPRRHRPCSREELVRYAQEQLPHLPRLTSRAAEETVPGMRRLIDALASLTRRLPHAPPRALAKLAHEHAGDPPLLRSRSRARTTSYYRSHRTRRPPGTHPPRPHTRLAGQPRHHRRPALRHRPAPPSQTLRDGPIDRRLNEATTPVALNLLDLTRTPPQLAPYPLTVVECPSVLEAAMEWASPQPMACTSGQLWAVDHALLQLAVDQGVPLRYAGDLDAAGLHIAATVQQTYGAVLVAMDTALVRAAGDRPSVIPLGPLPNSCDPELIAQLQATGRVLYQEHDVVLMRLLDPASSSRETLHPTPRQMGS
ncbi:hypothetical protein RKD20_009479 [Streptomyces sp. SLBN-8D4]